MFLFNKISYSSGHNKLHKETFLIFTPGLRTAILGVGVSHIILYGPVYPIIGLSWGKHSHSKMQRN